jgi:hypothetical protein
MKKQNKSILIPHFVNNIKEELIIGPGSFGENKYNITAIKADF